jgi:site-specific DNA-cytosine methylase
MNELNTQKQWKWGSIVPLIGGMSVANKMATGTNPAFLLSYPGFAGNDAHCVNYFKDSTPYNVIDPETNLLPESENKSLYHDVDFVSAVCPCAGLSMLNNSKGRGSDAKQNEWMYKSAELVLEQVKPKVFWGENAPGLYSPTGKGVVEKFQEMGEKNGYSLSLIKTDTFLHGIPQHRHRTFYFFWRGTEAPILNYYQRESPDLLEYLNRIPENASMMDLPFGMNTIDNVWFNFLQDKGISVSEVQNSRCKSVLDFYVDHELLPDLIQWSEEKGHDRMKNIAERVIRKKAEGKGWWDGSPLAPVGHINALISKNSGIVHPNGERPISAREAMWLMGLPNDFEMVDYDIKKQNHICQNVPVGTAKDWTNEVMRYINGEITEYGGRFVKQANASKRIDYRDKKIVPLF